MTKTRVDESVPREDGGFPYRLSARGDEISVIAELRGISEEMIRIDLDERVLTISVNGLQKYRTAIPLPWEARMGKKRFRDGVLELRLERKPGMPHPD